MIIVSLVGFMFLFDSVCAKIANFFVRHAFMKYRWFRLWIVPHATGEVIAWHCPYDSASSRKEVEACRIWHCPNYQRGKPCIDNFEEDDFTDH